MTKILENQTNMDNLKASKNMYLGFIACLALQASAFSSMASKALIMDKSCREHLVEKCDYLRDENELNNLHRYLYSFYVDDVDWISVLQCLLPITILLFLGGWSDKTGKIKVTLLLPIIGLMLQSLNGIVNVIYFNELPLVLHVFLDTFLVEVFGGLSLLFLALLNYTCKMTDAKTRIYHIVAIIISALSCIPICLALSDIILKSYGYLPIYGIALIVNIINLLYIIFKVSDNDRSNEQMMYDGQGLKHFLKNFFYLSIIKETIQVISKKTDSKRTLYLSLHLFIITILFISIFGELSVMDVIVRYYYKWDNSMITTFFIWYGLTTTLGLLLMFINKWLKCHEFTLGIISSVCKIVSALVFCFIPNNILFLIGPLFAMFNGGAFIAAISQCTKLLEKNEVSKINILICLLWNVAMLIYTPLKIRVNRDTSYELAKPQHVWGTVYLLGGAFALPALFTFIWLIHAYRRAERNSMDMDNLITEKN